MDTQGNNDRPIIQMHGQEANGFPEEFIKLNCSFCIQLVNLIQTTIYKPGKLRIPILDFLERKLP